MALLQTPLAYRILELFGCTKDPTTFVDQLGKSIQPTFDIAGMMYANQLEYRNGTITPSSGNNVLFTNDTGKYIRLTGASFRSGTAIGAGVSIDGFLSLVDAQVPTGPNEQLSDRMTYSAGQLPAFNPRSQLRTVPLIMGPNDFLGFWNTTIGAPPVCVWSVSWITMR